MKDCPSIQQAEYEGWESVNPHCPVCGEECNIVYKYMGLTVVGCDVCLQEFDAAEAEECFPAVMEVI